MIQAPQQFNPLDFGVRHWGKIALIVLGLYVIFAAAFSIQQYERGVVLRWGEFKRVAEPGLNFKIPFAESVQDVPTDILSAQPPERPTKKGARRAVNTYTADNQEIDILFTIWYRIPAKNVAFVWENARDYRPKILLLAEDRLKAEMGKVKLEHFAENRGATRDKVKAVMVRDALTLGLEVTDFQLTDVDYTDAFRTAVEKASVEKAGVETREWERQQEEKRAQTKKINAEGEANAARETAKGKADAIDSVAKAEARAIQVKGEATAAAMKAQANALSANPVLVEMKKAEQWNGALPQQLLSGVVPFMQFQAPAGK